MLRKPIFFIIILFNLVLVSCGDSTEDAIDSIEGDWTVNKIYNATGERVEFGINTMWDTTLVGDLGNFEFNENGLVSYNYMSHNSSIANASEWKLEKSSSNCGFVNCDNYTLTLGMERWECLFGDQTSDAHKNATDIQISMESTTIGPYSNLVLFLNKN